MKALKKKQPNTNFIKATSDDLTLFPKLGLYESWERDHVKDHVDDEQRQGEDKTNSKVEPSVEEN